MRWSLETCDGRGAGCGPRVQCKRRPTGMRRLSARLDFSVSLTDETWPRTDLHRRAVAGGRRSLQAASFVPTKHLALADPGIMATAASRRWRQIIIELSAHSLARLVECRWKAPRSSSATIISICLPVEGNASPARCPPDGRSHQAQAALKIRSVYDIHVLRHP